MDTEILKNVPFWKMMDIKLIEAEATGRAILEMPVRPEFFNAINVLHGGIASSLIDSAVAAAIFPMLSPGQFPVTVDLNVYYLRPVSQGTMVAEAQLIQRGRRICVGKVNVINEGQLVAYGTATYIILSRDRGETREPTG